jgi:hypothetical protein
MTHRRKLRVGELFNCTPLHQLPACPYFLQERSVLTDFLEKFPSGCVRGESEDSGQYRCRGSGEYKITRHNARLTNPN